MTENANQKPIHVGNCCCNDVRKPNKCCPMHGTHAPKWICER